MKKLFLFFLTVITLSLCASAQTRTVTGTVLDAETQEELIGASVSAGTGYGVATDANGNFTLKIPATATSITVSYVGYQTKHVSVKEDGKLLVLLTPDAKLLDPIIVVAYGEQKKSSFTGSAAVVGSAQIEKTQVTNVLDVLSGKVAGLQLSNVSGAPGTSNPTIRIRGISSIQAGGDPLVIVDGAPYTGDINAISPNDIESMSVLKDAASNALYGARGANGVILITTKRGKLGDAVITVDAKWGANSRASQNYNYLTSPAQYYEQYYKALYNYANTPEIYHQYPGSANPINVGGMGMSSADAHQWANSKLTGTDTYGLGYNVYTVPEGQYLIGSNGKLNPNATLGRMVNYKGADYWLTPDDWMKYVYQHSLRQEYNFSVSQGTDKSNFFASVNYLYNDGIIVSKSDYKRFSGRLAADIQAKSWLKLGANVSYAHANMTAMEGEEGASNSTGNLFAIATQIAPIYPLFMRDGNKQIMRDERDFARYDYGNNLNGGALRPYLGDSNAISDALLNTSKMTDNNITATGFAEIRFLKDFKFTTNNNVSVYESRGTETVNPYYGQYAESKGIVYKSHVRNTDFNFQQLLNWSHVFDNSHNLSILAGHEWYKGLTEVLSGQRHLQFDPNNDELNGAVIEDTPSSYTSTYNSEGWLGRVQYDYDSKYFASGSFRRDASSRFHPKHRWGNFWSVGAAWLINKEDFFNVDWVNLLKLKVSYGEQGNDQIGSYRYTDIYQLVNSNGSAAAIPSTKGNENITWEKNGNFNAGFEFGLFNDRLSGSIEGFYRHTSDMLLYFPLPASYGYMGYYDNVGNMANAGIEVELAATPIRTRDFTWTINANLTWYKNRITMLPDERKGDTVDGVSGFQSSGIFYGEGIPMYTYIMKKFAGVDPETGRALYYRNVTDANGKPTGEVTTIDDYAYGSDYLVGTALAPVYGGFSTSFDYKGFDLSASFNYQIGGRVYDSNYASLMGSPYSGNRGVNIHADMLNSWTPENPNTNIPRYFYGDQTTASTSDRFWTNASYLSLENINFGYTFPSDVVKKLTLSRVRIYFAADNIWVWSKRQGLDPRQSFLGGNNNTYYAPIRTLSGGLTVTF